MTTILTIAIIIGMLKGVLSLSDINRQSPKYANMIEFLTKYE